MSRNVKGNHDSPNQANIKKVLSSNSKVSPALTKKTVKSKTAGSAATNQIDTSPRCGCCFNIVRETDSALQCELCFKWGHIQCLEVSEAVYAELVGDKGTQWFCGPCGNIQKICLKFVDLEKQMECFNKVKEQVKVLVEENKSLKERLSACEEQLDFVHNEAHSMKVTQVRLEQYGLKNNLIIKGIPAKKEENLENTINKICNLMSLQIPNVEIVAIHRLKESEYHRTNNKSPDIIVKFLKYSTKMRVLNRFKELSAFIKKRKAKNINNANEKKSKSKPNHGSKLFAEFPSIELWNHLTPYCALVMRKASKLVKEGKLKYAWYNNNRLLVKVTDNSVPINICMLEELYGLVSYENQDRQD